jgi:hypothetical protein
MDEKQIIEIAQRDPKIQSAIDAIEAQLSRMPIMPEDLDEIITMLEFVLKNPDKYQEVMDAAVRDGDLPAELVPPQFDRTVIISVLVALYGVRNRMAAPGYATGGLKRAARELQAAGRGGDSMLAHINPREAEILRRMGGNGTVNPNTGLREYKSGKQIIGAVLPIALNFIAPGIGTAIGTALGASGTAATMLGSAIIGGASSAISGGDPLKGAVLGGLGAGFGSYVGSGIDKALGLGMGEAGRSMLGSGLVGGITGMATGQGFGRGVAQGVLGSVAGDLAGGTGNAMIGSGGRMFGNMLAAGYKPKEAVVGGTLAGLATGFTQGRSMGQPKDLGSGLKPSDAAVEGLKLPAGSGPDIQGGYTSGDFTLTGKPDFQPMTVDYGLGPAPGSAVSAGVDTSGLTPATPGVDLGSGLKMGDASLYTPGAQEPGILSKLGNMSGSQMLTGAMLLNSLASAPPDVQDAVKSMSPEQREYFNRPSITWDWDAMRRDAAASGMSLGQYMARSWPQITSGGYNKAAPTTTAGTTPPPGAARGGALSKVAYLARGSGSGRADTINARLSDGEYVMDAETVAMLGDGSTQAGAKRLDEMRANLRAHKGKSLAKGKFSPNAKSPLNYLKGAA